MSPSRSHPPYQLFVGVDIAAASFTASWTRDAVSYERPRTFEQTSEGFSALQRSLDRTSVAPKATLIVLEVTGTYWIRFAVSLFEAGYVVSVVDPTKARKFAESHSQRAKTDALDAQLLARFAYERQPAAWTPPAAVYHELRQRLVVRDGLLQVRQQTRNQRHALLQWPVVVQSALEALDKVLAEVDAQLALVNADIEQVLREGAWASSATLLLSISGIGTITAAWLLVATLNFTTCTSAEGLAAYVGLVPYVCESGTSVRKRKQVRSNGNGRLRTALYMATLAATRYNAQIKAQYERLRAVGKPHKVARCAAARKLVHLAYAVVTKGQPFDPNYQTRRQPVQTSSD